MSQQLSELCSVLIDQTLGTLPAAIFSTLAARGRLTLAQLLRFSNLTSRYLKHGLAVLVQHQLVYHVSPDDHVTYYEAHVRNAYNLVRNGKYAELVETRFGAASADIILELQSHGTISISTHNLKNTLNAGDSTGNEAKDLNENETETGAAPNGRRRDCSNTKMDEKFLDQLFDSRHVVRALPIDFMPPQDFHEMVEDLVRENNFAALKGKDKVELASKVISRKRKMIDDNKASLDLLYNSQQLDAKDPEPAHLEKSGSDQEPSELSRKKRRLNSGLGYGDTVSTKGRKGHVIDPDVGETKIPPKRRLLKTKRTKEDHEHDEPSQRPKKQRKGDGSNPVRRSRKVANNKNMSAREVNGGPIGGFDGADERPDDHWMNKLRHANNGEDGDPEYQSDVSEAASSIASLKKKKNKRRLDPDDDTNGFSHLNSDEVQELDDGENFDEIESDREGEIDSVTAVDDHQAFSGVAEANDDYFDESASVSLRLNSEKFDVSIRTQCLVDFATQYLGEPTSKVYAALLRCVEQNIARCQDPYAAEEKFLRDAADSESDDDADLDPDYSASTFEVENELGAGVDLSWGVELEKTFKGKPNGVHDSQTNHHFSDEKPNRIAEIELHLQLLAEHAHRFVYPHTVRNLDTKKDEKQWHVDFRELALLLIQLTLEDVIAARFDTQSARLVRLLNLNGKLEEKQLADLTLIPQKELRQKLATLQESGCVDLQELPRDATRQPSRTIYLWYFDQERCRKHMLEDTYKTMARLLQRARVEMEQVRTVIEKSERTDVVGREDKYLSTAEKEALQEWRAKEAQIWIHVARLDDMVALLRDFLPTD